MSYIRDNNYFINLLKSRSNNWELVGDYINAKTNVTCRCKRCGEVITKKARYFMEYQQMCPTCDGARGVRIGINDVKSQNPQLAALFVDQNMVDKVAINSHKEIELKCPECGTIDKYEIAGVTRRRFSCRACSSGRSYPNKLMFNLLRLKLKNFKPEFRPEWANGRQYDFMFNFNNKNYIVEMDGSFHYFDNQMNGMSHEEQIKIDQDKTTLAEKYGFIVIRIDCNYLLNNRFEYIKSNILSSKLHELLLFDNSDFISANSIAEKSDLVHVCDLYDNCTHDIGVLMKETGLSYGVIINKLIDGANIGICSYNHEEQKIIRNEERKKKTAKANGTPILCLETNEIFYSIALAKRIYGGGIDQYLKGNRTYAGKLDDGTELHYKRIAKSDINKLLQSGNYTYIDVMPTM